MDQHAPVTQLSTTGDVSDLARHLLDPDRDRTVVVITTPYGQTPRVDAAHIAAELDGIADVVIIPTGDLTRAMEGLLPPRTHVFGGASRVYPTSTSWHTDPHAAPLRFCWEETDPAHVADLLIEDALRHRQYRGQTPPPAPERAEGTIIGLITPDRALVRTTAGRTVVLSTDTLFADLTVDQLYKPGMTVTGTLSADHREIVPDITRTSAADALASIAAGTTVLAQVQRAYEKDAVVSLFPGVHTKAARPSGAKAGDIVAAAVETVGKSDGQGWVLHLERDCDPDALTDSPSILPDGPPWLTPPPPRESEEPEEAPVDDPAGTEPATGPTPAPIGEGPVRLELDRALRELAAANRDRRDLRDERGRLRAELDEVARQNAHLRASLEKSRARPAPKVRAAASESHREEGPWFLDSCEQLRFDVYVAWAKRIPAAEKATLPLADYDLADGFVESVANTQGVDRSKVIDVIVEVLTGLADTMPGRGLHRLRDGTASGAPVTHPTLGTAWRANIQTNSASARRLHFWRAAAGRVTLAKIGVHDDMTITA